MKDKMMRNNNMGVLSLLAFGWASLFVANAQPAPTPQPNKDAAKKSKVILPKKPGEIKESAFECGLESKGDPWVQFNVQYYLYALAFVIFDIEVIFLYPWAVAFTGLSFGAFLAMGIFILLLAESLIYLWIKGVLTWK